MVSTISAIHVATNHFGVYDGDDLCSAPLASLWQHWYGTISESKGLGSVTFT